MSRAAMREIGSDWASVRDSLRGDGAQLGHKTTLQLRLGEHGREPLAVQYHDTDVVTFHWNGDITLDSGEWLSVTTAHRISTFVPPEFGWLKNRQIQGGGWGYPDGEWWWVYPCTRVRPFFDGMILTADHKAPKLVTADAPATATFEMNAS